MILLNMQKIEVGGNWDRYEYRQTGLQIERWADR